MTPFSPIPDGAGDPGAVPGLLQEDPARRRSVLDRMETPYAVFGVLGSAALIGLALAFAVVHGLERLGGARPEQHADVPAARNAPQAAPAPAPAPNPALARTLSPALQYQELNASSAGETPGVGNGRPNVSPEVASAAADSQAQLRYKLTAPFIPPVARTARSAIALAPAPRIPPPLAVTINNAEPSKPAASEVQQIRVPVPSTIRNMPDAQPGDVSRNPVAPINTASDHMPFSPERSVAAVLQAAARADAPGQERSILEAADNVRRGGAANHASADSVGAARRFNEEANRAYWINKDVAQALLLERRAYDANPTDVEIAGNLAFYYLKQSPPHAAAAREVVLHALTASSPRYRTGRLEDWMSLGIANALMGRRDEAENAFLASAALGNNLDRACRGALSAVASYGEAVRPAAIALLRRVHEQGRSTESPYCAWPPDWALGKRYP